jgi:hypothetical protein
MIMRQLPNVIDEMREIQPDSSYPYFLAEKLERFKSADMFLTNDVADALNASMPLYASDYPLVSFDKTERLMLEYGFEKAFAFFVLVEFEAWMSEEYGCPVVGAPDQMANTDWELWANFFGQRSTIGTEPSSMEEALEHLTVNGLYPDSEIDDLYLCVVDDRRHWQLNYVNPMTKGNSVLDLGDVKSVPIAEAREKALENMALVEAGHDPAGLQGMVVAGRA